MADAAGETTGAAQETPAVQPSLLLLTDDLPIRRRLQRLAADHGLVITEAGPAGAGGAGDGGPAAAVIDLHLPGALDLVRAWRARWPEALLAGYLTEPDREQWVAAQRAGCDLVSNRGALVLRLRELLARGAAAVRAFPLLDAADAAGRLGLVLRAADTPVGPVAVFRVAGRLHAIADRCPHAGAALSGGETDGSVLTCPGHGSRFDIRTGERLRGPADTGVPVFPLAEEGGQICLLLRG